MESQKFSLPDLVDRFLSHFRIVLRYWWLVGLISLVFGVINYIRAKQIDENYAANQSFMVKEDEGSSSLFSNLLGQFGLSGGRKGEYNLDRLVRIAQSRKIMVQTMFSRAEIDGKEDYLVNHIMDIYDFETEYRFKKSGKYLPNKVNLESLTIDQTQLLFDVYGLLIGGSKKPGKFFISYNDESGIIYSGFGTRNEQLSKVLTDIHYKHLSRFYVIQAKEKQELTYNKLVEKKDSLHGVLKAKEYELAKMSDQGFGIILNQNRVGQSRLSNEIFLLNTMYSELIKNVENASFNLKNATPVFQIIDAPQYPLDKAGGGTIRMVLTGLIVGGLLGIGFVVARTMVLEAYSDRE